jgi:hypothetical protein
MLSQPEGGAGLAGKAGGACGASAGLGRQLTVGGAGSPLARRGGTGYGRASGGCGEAACWLEAVAERGDAAAADELPEGLTAGVGKGPESSEQPEELQPVAAGPAKVGGNWPRLDDMIDGGGPAGRLGPDVLAEALALWAAATAEIAATGEVATAKGTAKHKAGRSFVLRRVNMGPP